MELGSRHQRPSSSDAPAAPDPAAIASPLFQRCETARGIVLAVSGGPDSIALMLLAAAWIKTLAQPPRLAVATVDHGLRKGSRGEAEQVAAWAAALGLPHRCLVWEGEKPATRIQERAREARYQRLIAHAREIGADIVVTAHHADDQAETILFRLSRGSGIGGLSGMAEAVQHDGVTHLRPLLGLAKAELIALCAAQGHPFLTDPSNANPAFARTRLRALAETLAAHGLDREALLRLGGRAARAEAALRERTAAVAAALPATREDELFSGDIGLLATEPEEIVLRVLDREMSRLGRGRPLRLDRLESLTSGLRAALSAGAPFAATLGGVVLRLDRRRVLRLRPEPTRRRGRP